jgi:hypothetical protein
MSAFQSAGRSRVAAVGFALTVMFLATIAPAGEAPMAQIRKLTGKPTKIAWIRGSGAGANMFGAGRDGNRAKLYKVMAIDTETGTERCLTPEVGSLRHPQITPSGARVVFDDLDRNVYIVDWNGKNLRKLVEADAVVGVAEDPPGKEWVYVSEGINIPEGRQDPEGYKAVIRYQIDNLGKREVVWDKTASIEKWEFTRDGKLGASRFPWQVASVGLPNGEMKIVADIGCTPGISADGILVMHMITMTHDGVMIYNRDRSNIRTIRFPGGKAEGLNNGEYWWAAFARYDPRFMTFGGPYTQGGHADIYFIEFNPNHDGVVNWVRVTNTEEIDIHAYCLIGEPAKAPTISAQPADQKVKRGAKATFAVKAMGSPEPTYQWQINGKDIAGANEPSLTVELGSENKGAKFQCVVKNSAGSATSKPALLKADLKDLDAAVQGEWDAKLKARLKEYLQGGKTITLTGAAAKDKKTITRLDDSGSLRFELAKGVEGGLAWNRLTNEDKAALALAALREKEPADHGLAAFFLNVVGRDDEAEPHLQQAGKEAEAIRALFK